MHMYNCFKNTAVAKQYFRLVLNLVNFFSIKNSLNRVQINNIIFFKQYKLIKCLDQFIKQTVLTQIIYRTSFVYIFINQSLKTGELKKKFMKIKRQNTFKNLF